MRIKQGQRERFHGRRDVRGSRPADSSEPRRPPGELGGLATVEVVKVLLVCDAAWVRNQVRAALSGSAEIVEVTDPPPGGGRGRIRGCRRRDR